MKESEAKQERTAWELAASQDRYIEAVQSLEQVWGTFHIYGDVHNKAQLYDEEKGAAFGAKIIKILVDFAHRVETSLHDIRKLVRNILESARPDLGPEMKAIGTRDSSRRWLIRISLWSQKEGFPPVQRETTLELV